MFLRWFLYWLPKHSITICIGKIAQSPLSRWLIPWYIRKYQINAAEANRPVHEYQSLLAFFTRELHPSARRFDTEGFLSPVDGLVTVCGEIQPNMKLQVKGEAYTTDDLLCEDGSRFLGGWFVVLYLSPKDYHRIHMPSDGTITRWTYIPGKLFPVNRLGLQHVHRLYSKNERIVSYALTESGGYAVIKVGAMGVGSVSTPYTTHHRHHRAIVSQEVSLPLRRGQQLGVFQMGSTVILLFEPGVVREVLVQSGSRVQVGELIAR